MPYRVHDRSKYAVKGAILLGALLIVIGLGVLVSSQFSSRQGQEVFLSCHWEGSRPDCHLAYSG